MSTTTTATKAPPDPSPIVALNFPPAGYARGYKGKRESQEDQHIYAKWTSKHRQQIEMFGVFDGHGGGDASKAAAYYMPYHLQRNLNTLSDLNHRKIGNACRQAFYDMQNQLLQMDPARYNKQGTTACICLRIGDTLYCANCGDSRAVLVRNTGRVIELSSDHKPNYPEEKARIEKMGGKVYADQYGTFRERKTGLSVSRSLGDLESYCSQSKHFLISPCPAIHTEVLQKGRDVALLIACDGLWDVVQSNEIGTLAIPDHPKTTVEKLIKLAADRETGDNVTIMFAPLFPPPVRSS